MSSPRGLVATGSIPTDGNLATVAKVGFRPSKVTLWHTDGDEAVWSESMADNSMMKRTAAGTGTFATTNGVIPLANGFSIGADADVNPNGGVLHFEALGG